jgi:hypothetical protein
MNLMIAGGTISATVSIGAGIGAGDAAAAVVTLPSDVGFFMSSWVDCLIIRNGVIAATGSNGAGNGAGYGALPSANESHLSSVGRIVILGGTILASGSNGSGIGGGAGNSTVGNLTITGGAIVGDSSFGGAGIGGGFGDFDAAMVGLVRITSGTITAIGSDYGAAIDSSSVSAVRELVLGGKSFILCYFPLTLRRKSTSFNDCLTCFHRPNSGDESSSQRLSRDAEQLALCAANKTVDRSVI